jgi:hypothetical protein
VDWRKVSPQSSVSQSCRLIARPVDVSTTARCDVGRGDRQKGYLESLENGRKKVPSVGDNAEATLNVLLPHLVASTALLSESSETRFESEETSSSGDDSSVLGFGNGGVCTIL